MIRLFDKSFRRIVENDFFETIEATLRNFDELF